jgi:polynucleotide 5'-hydroxyl-kinase GRC3/NOL9
MRFSTMRGTILVLGATNTGKTTFARYLYHRLSAYHERLAFVDGDMGQATLGPPTTITLALSASNDHAFPPTGPRFSAFVGDISPCGHMLPTVVGAHKLVEKAHEEGATAVVFDTTGLVAASQGGGALKRALVELLRPKLVIAIQRGTELEHLLVPLRRSRRTRVIDRRVAGKVRRRDVEVRQKHRAQQFRRAFTRAQSLVIDWHGVAVMPSPSFSPHRLVALEDEFGFVLALGIVTGLERSRHTVELLTPLISPERVDLLRIGDVTVDPTTFRDRRL